MNGWAEKEQRAKVIAAYGSLAIPLCIAGATAGLTFSQQRRSDAETCREKTMKFYDESMAALDKLEQLEKAGQSIKADITNRQAIAFALLTESCNNGGVTIPPGVRKAIEWTYAFSPEEATRESLADSVKRAESATEDGIAAAKSVLAANRTAPASGNVRVYIHISDEAQRPAAARLEASLEQQSLDGRKIVVPGIQMIPGKYASSLRCLKRADCAKAPELAAMIGRAFPGLGLNITNLSGRFELEAGVKARTYEVWLGPNAQIAAETE